MNSLWYIESKHHAKGTDDTTGTGLAWFALERARVTV